MFWAANSWTVRFAVLALLVLALFLGLSVAVAQESAPRTTLELSSARFYFGELPEEAATSAFNDHSWSAVSLPHTWNRLGEAGTSRSEATNNKRGTGWYRMSFAGPAKERGRRYFLQFDAVSNLADVWLNGTKLGTHAGAFSRFRFDITDVLRPDEPNLLVVKADNTKPAPGARTQDIIPLDGDFFVYGGIYRGVSLIATEEVHVDMLDHAGPGIYAHTTSITEGRADIAVLTKLRNDSTRSRKVSVVTRLVDEGGREVARKAETARIASHANAEIRAALTVANPHLWNGRADPYLYRVTVDVLDRGRVLDRVEQPLGIRSIRIDPDEGLFLNGKYLPLRGVSRHQDRAGKGWALHPADHEDDMALIVEMGANAVRFAHYQHAPEWFDLADRHGMLVWSEIPFVHQANFTLDEPTPALVANARQQLTEAIRQNYNHPSVFTWSVGNEVNIGNFLHDRKSGKSLGLLRDLHELAKSEDPSRLTVFADCCETPPMRIPNAEPLAGTTDLIGYNRYYGWYYGKPTDLGPALDTFHQRHPELPVSVSEYGAGGALSQHTDNPLAAVVNMMGRPHPEEFENWYHEQSWPQIAARRFVWGSFIWNMFDFSSDFRDEGDMVDINDKGLVSFDRKTRKDAFFYYKAQWSSEPVVHITSGRYVDRPYAIVDVRVYSNAPTVRVKINERDLGATECPNRVCVLRDVLLAAGENTVTASADVDGQAVSHTVQWNAPDRAVGLRIDAGNFVGHRTADGHVFGPDQFFSAGQPGLLRGLSGGGFSSIKQEDKVVEGATDPVLFEGYRSGTFWYDIPLPNREWTVTLHSFEPNASTLNARTFSVSANNRAVLKAWDPAKAAGGVMKAAKVSFKVKVVNGHLKLQFAPVGGPALIAAIEVTP